MLHSLAVILFAAFKVLFKLLPQGATISMACLLRLPRFWPALNWNIGRIQVGL